MHPVHRAVLAVLDLLPGASGRAAYAYPPPENRSEVGGGPEEIFAKFWLHPPPLNDAPVLVLTVESRPSFPPLGAVNLQQFTTVYDWLAATALSVRPDENESGDLADFPHVVVVDALSVHDSSAWSGGAFEQLAGPKTWFTVVNRDEIGRTLKHLVDAIARSESLDAREKRQMAARARHVSLSLDLVRALWRGRLTDAGDRESRHAISNLIGPQILALGAPSHPAIAALHKLMKAIRLAPTCRPEPTVTHLPSDVHLVLMDDMAFLGWRDFVIGATHGKQDRLTVITDVLREKIKDGGTLIEVLRERVSDLRAVSRFSRNLSLTGHPDEILLLDLRLFNTRADERAFLEELVDVASESRLVADLPQRGETWSHPDAPLTLLPKVIAALDPSLPIIVFSSTGSRYIAQTLGEIPSVILDFEKPRFFGDDAARCAERTYEQFAVALRKALRLAEARGFLRRITARAKDTRAIPPPPFLHVFIDESSKDPSNLAVGAVILESATDPLEEKACEEERFASFSACLEETPIDESNKNAGKVFWSLSATQPRWEPDRSRIAKDPGLSRQTAVIRAIKKVAKSHGCSLSAFALRAPIRRPQNDDALALENIDNLYRVLLTGLLEIVLFDFFDWSARASCSIRIDVATRTPSIPKNTSKEEMRSRFGVQFRGDRHFYSVSSDDVLPMLSAMQAFRLPQRFPSPDRARGVQLVSPEKAWMLEAQRKAAEEKILLPDQIHYLADWVSRWANTAEYPEEALEFFTCGTCHDWTSQTFQDLSTALRAGSRCDFVTALSLLAEATGNGTLEDVPFFAWRRGQEWMEGLTPEMFRDLAGRAAFDVEQPADGAATRLVLTVPTVAVSTVPLVPTGLGTDKSPDVVTGPVGALVPIARAAADVVKQADEVSTRTVRGTIVRAYKVQRFAHVDLTSGQRAYLHAQDCNAWPLTEGDAVEGELEAGMRLRRVKVMLGRA